MDDFITIDPDTASRLAGPLGALILVFLSLKSFFKRRRGRRPSVSRNSPDTESVARLREGIHEQARDYLELYDLYEAQKVENESLRAEISALRSRIVEAEDLEVFRILGLNPSGNLDRATLRKAYIQSVKKAHPDTGGSPEAFARVEWAHQHLKKRFSL